MREFVCAEANCGLFAGQAGMPRIVLGTLLWARGWSATQAAKRMGKEQRLLDQLPNLGDLQCAWLMLAMSCVPRANHTIRTLSPNFSAPYATLHDNATFFWGGTDAADEHH